MKAVSPEQLGAEAPYISHETSAALGRVVVAGAFVLPQYDRTYGTWESLCIDEVRIYHFSDGTQMSARILGADYANATTAAMKHHGTPGGRGGPHPDAGVLWQRGIRLVAPDRSGYGFTTPMPDRSVADLVPKFAAVMDYEANEKAIRGVFGQSGGGPYTLACLALSESFERGVSLAGLAPRDLLDGKFVQGMSPDNERQHNTISDRELQSESEQLSAQLQEDELALINELLEQRNPDGTYVVTGEDRRALYAYGRSLGMAQAEGMRVWRGQGKAEDVLALRKPWGFDPRTITKPTIIWCGKNDPFSPIGHSQWLVENLPGAVDAIGAGVEGHFGSLQVMMRALQWIGRGPFIRAQSAPTYESNLLQH